MSLGLDDVQDGFPLLYSRVNTGGVMRTGMQNENGSVGSVLQEESPRPPLGHCSRVTAQQENLKVFDETLKVKTPGLLLVVAILPQFGHVRIPEDVHMIA